MIDLSADHIGFVLASYAIVAIVLVGLIINVMTTSRKLKRELADLNLPEPGQK